MSRLTNSQLQAALTSLSKANNKAFVMREKIAAHCEEVYGCDPADVDFDAFIDACDGGNGTGGGMTAAEFDEGMREALERNRP